MDMLTIIKLALFVPFFLVLTVFAVVYLINGYKKDLGKSLVSIAATVVALLLSMLLAKLIGRAVSGPVSGMLPLQTSEVATIAGSFIKGAIEIILSFVLFFIFFIISLAVLKSVGKKINLGKLECINTGKTGTRIAGMAIRGVDAVLVTVMLLLPFYGTVAMVAPPAAALMRMSESTEGSATLMQSTDTPSLPMQYAAISVKASASPSPVSEEASTSEVLQVMAEHPVLLPYKYGPGAWAYSELSSFSMNGKQVDIASAAESLEVLLDKFESFLDAIETEDEAKVLSATDALIDFARKKVVNQRWSYDMVMALVGEADDLVKQYSSELSQDEEFTKIYGILRPLLDMSFEEYTHNAEGLLDFAAWGLDKYKELAKIAKSGDTNDLSEADALVFMTGLMDEAYTRIGDLINHSDQAVGLKRFILLMYTEMRLFDTVPSSSTAVRFIDKYYGDGYVSEEDRRAEAIAFITLLDAHEPLDVAAALACNPLFGADAIIETFGNNLYIHGLSIGDQLNTNDRAEEAFNTLNGMLRAYKGNSMIQFSRFSEQAESYLIDEIGLEYGYGQSHGGISNVGGADVEAIRVMMGEDGKMYIIPTDIYYEIISRGELTEETIKEFGLQPIDVNINEDGEGSVSYGDVEIDIDGNFSYSDIEVGSGAANEYFVTIKP